MRPRPEGPTAIGNERLLRVPDVIAALNIGRRTFERLLSSGRFPQPDLRIGRVVLWRPATLARWIEAETRHPGGKGGGPWA